MMLMLIKYQFLKKEPCGTTNDANDNDNDTDAIRPLYVRLPQMTGYARKYDENATRSLRANNEQLLKNYIKIWEKVKELSKINFESKPVYGDDDKYIKTKIKIYAGSVITKFS